VHTISDNANGTPAHSVAVSKTNCDIP